MNSEVDKTEAITDDEISIARRRLEEATAKKSALEAQRLAKAQDDLQKHLHAQEMERAAQRDYIREIEAKHAERKRLEAESREAERRQAEQAQRELEQRVAQVEAEKQARIAKEREAIRLSELAFQQEQEARQLERELLNLTTVAKPEPVITVMSPSHPLSKVLNPSGASQVEPETIAPAHFDPPQALTRREIKPEEGSYFLSEWRGRTTGKFAPPSPLQIINTLLVADNVQEAIDALEAVLNIGTAKNVHEFADAVVAHLSQQKAGQ